MDGIATYRIKHLQLQKLHYIVKAGTGGYRMGKTKRGQKSNSFLGVDIGASRVKLLELEGKPGALRVASYAAEPLPAYSVSDYQIINVDAVGEAIGRAVKKSGTRNKQAAIAVSGAAVISKTITMPAEMRDREIEQQVMLEAPQHIPYPIENVSLDFQVLGPDPNNDARNEVLLVACRRDNIEMRTAVLEVAGLKPQLVDVEEYALRNACSLLRPQMVEQGRDSTIAVFEMGAQRTRLNVQHNQRSVYHREETFGGQLLADELVAQLGLPDANHLLTQLQEGRISSSEIEPGLTNFCEQAARQIEGALQFYFSTEAQTESIDQILVTGGCTLYPDFMARLQERLIWPVASADPLAGIRAGGKAKRNHIEQDGPALLLAAGLSMRAML